MKRRLSAWIRDHPAMAGLLIAGGLSAAGRALRYVAAKRGWRLAPTLRGLALGRGARRAIFLPRDLFAVATQFDAIMDRLVWPEGGGTINLSGPPLRCAIARTGDQLWIPEVGEVEDVGACYLARWEPAPGAVVWDVGASFGELTIVLSRLVGPGGRVVAFEPDPRNLVWLERNVREAGLTNVTLCTAGLWHETGTLSFASTGGMDSALAHLHEKADAAKIEVPVVGWSEACARFGAPAFVKMDIEGAELEVVRAALPSLRGSDTRFAIASYHVREGRPTAEALEAMFQSIGYRVETGNPEHKTTWAAPK